MLQLNTMNEAQMIILESFAGATEEQQVNNLMNVLRLFYARRLDQEMNQLLDKTYILADSTCRFPQT